MLLKRGLLLILLAAGSGPALWAQVNKAAMRTTGLSCGFCAGLSELDFKKMQGVDKVNISLSKEIVIVTYKSGAPFDPAQIRKILEPWMVTVLQFQVSARGKVQEQGGKRLFLAGKDSFALVASTNGPAVPTDAMIDVEGIVNDRANPRELKILTLKPAVQ